MTIARDIDDHPRMTAFVLGAMPEEERLQFEEETILDDALFDQLETVEDELVDAYVRDELEAVQRHKLENLLDTSPRLRQRIVLARSLATRLARDPAPRRRPRSSEKRRQWVAAAAIAAIGLGTSWLGWANLSHREQLAALESDRQALDQRAQQLESSLAEERALTLTQGQEISQRGEQIARLETEVARIAALRGTAPVAVSFVLSLDVLRSEQEVTRYLLPEEADLVRLQLDLDGDSAYSSFKMAISNRRGETLWTQDALGAQALDWGEAVVVEVPAMLFDAGRYEVALQGVTADGRFRDVGFYDLDIGQP